MFKIKKKDAWATSINCVFMSIDIVLVSFFVNFGHNSDCVLVFLLLTCTGKYKLGIRQFHFKLALNLSYHLAYTAIFCKSFIPCSKQNHIQFKKGFTWVLLKLFSHNNTRYNYIWQQLLSWKRSWMSDLIVLNIICLQIQKQLATLN